MTKPIAYFHGQLKRMPFPNKASVAQLQILPLITLHDHEVLSEFKSHDVPVYLNVAEHYRLLTMLINVANELWPDLSVLIRFSMPGGCQIAPTLLRDNVFILQDIKSEELKLSGQQRTLLVIDDNFAHFELDNGNNKIALRLYSGSEGNEYSLKPLVDILIKSGVIET